MENVPLISAPITARVQDLFNASYSLAIESLCRFYVHEKERLNEVRLLAKTSVGLMSRVIKPLGRILTSPPIGAHFPSLNAGPCFELQPKEYILPHREEAFMILQERIVELANFSGDLSNDCKSASLKEKLNAVKQNLLGLAKGLQLTWPT